MRPPARSAASGWRVWIPAVHWSTTGCWTATSPISRPATSTTSAAAASTATASPSRPALSTTWRPTSVVWLGPAPSPHASAWTWALAH
ncbi:hypothetical protein G6F24_018337 [Rhizopus arrhizus]|nr:hypothetical protein G6F24_018337 [Rhizopus arrhizus]